jgi:tRNA modification GTPase
LNFRDQTIFALSSGRPPAAIAIVRISGRGAGPVLEALCGRLPVARSATWTTLRDAAGQPIDEAVCLWFPAPHSATGEDIAELHVHGGKAILAAVFDVLGKMGGLRAAEPGEFTRRAFENGKIDLTEAEGLDDLIHADTEHQRRQALRQLKGLLGHKAESWRRQIIEASALIEAGIDFSDEGDVPDELIAPSLAKIDALKKEIEETLAASAQSERLRDGLVVAIAGLPNAGKSTLLNRIARREAAIVSPYAGTTRDVIEVHLDLDGYPVTLLDTAGVRETIDPVEREGVRRARERAASADLVLWLTDADELNPGAFLSEACPRAFLDPWVDAGLREENASNQNSSLPVEGEGVPVWLVRNKIDLAQPAPWPDRQVPQFEISAAQGQGLTELMAALVQYAQEYFGSGETALISRTRHRALLREATEALRRAGATGEAELMAEELRIAIHSLGQLTGRVDVEDVLDVIFRDFCIGK